MLVSQAALTRYPWPSRVDASVSSQHATSWAPPPSALQGLTSWPQYASSESFQRLAFPYSLPSLSLQSLAGVEAVRPQVHVALLPLLKSQKVSLNLEVLLNLQVSSRHQPRRHAVLPHVLWHQERPFSGIARLCVMIPSASISTSHRELSALSKMVLSPENFAESQQNCQMHVYLTHLPVAHV